MAAHDVLSLVVSCLLSIRCVKPNPNKAALQYDGQMVFEQLTYAGVFEAITIRKQGFPFRLTHADFYLRYKCLFPNTHRWSANNIENCKTLIQEMKQSFQLVQIGTTKVLYRAEQHRDMELRRNLAVEEVTVSGRADPHAEAAELSYMNSTETHALTNCCLSFPLFLVFQVFIQKHLRIKLTALLVERCKKARPVYAAAIASRSMEQVEAALASGCNTGFKTVEYYRCERMIHVFREERRLEGVLAILISQNPHECFAQFNEAVTSANEIEMNTPNAQRARELFAEAVAYRAQIDGEAGEQVQRLEEPAMKTVLEKADAIGYSSEHLEKIRALLYDTAEDAFVKMQLKAAVLFKDRERVTRTTIRLKDLFFEKSGDMFKVRTPKQTSHSVASGGRLHVRVDGSFLTSVSSCSLFLLLRLRSVREIRQAVPCCRLVRSQIPVHGPRSTGARHAQVDQEPHTQLAHADRRRGQAHSEARQGNVQGHTPHTVIHS